MGDAGGHGCAVEVVVAEVLHAAVVLKACGADTSFAVCANIPSQNSLLKLGARLFLCSNVIHTIMSKSRDN